MIKLLSIYPEDDVHGMAVGRCLESLNVEEIRIDASRLYEHNLFAIDPLDEEFLEGRTLSSLSALNSAASSSKFDRVYWRRPWMVQQCVALAFPTAQQLAAAEASHSLRLALEALPEDYFPLGHPVILNSTGNKLLQLAMAKKHGFHVPRTIVSNDVAQLTAFLKQHPRVVVKPLHASVAWKQENREEIDQLLWCKGVRAADLIERLSSISKAQLMIQEAVPRASDWRITVLPHMSICCEIDTRHLTEDEPDWRKQSSVLSHKIIPISGALDHQLRSYLKSLRLNTGYFDFVVEPSGRPVFLEVNTNANWLWIEEATGFPISLEIARCLAADRKAA